MKKISEEEIEELDKLKCLKRDLQKEGQNFQRCYNLCNLALLGTYRTNIYLYITKVEYAVGHPTASRIYWVRAVISKTSGMIYASQNEVYSESAVSFEEVFESVSERTKEELLYHLGLFVSES